VTGSPIQTICGTVILLAVLATIATLAIQGTVAGAEAMVAITAIIGIAGGIVAVHSGVTAGANAAGSPMPPPEQKEK
jgi:hypothetical protein